MADAGLFDPNPFDDDPTRQKPQSPTHKKRRSTSDSSSSGSGGGSTPSGGNPRSADASFARNQILYTPDNPVFAARNAMLDQGMNPFVANPFLQAYQRTLSALPIAFMMSNATGGMTPEGLADAGGTGGMYRDYLGSAISGGNAYQQLAGAQGQLPSLMGSIKDMQQQQAGDPNAMVNPFLAQLAQTFGSQQGLQGALGNLFAPFMSQSMGQSYNNALGPMMEGAVRNMGEQDPLGNSNFWEYLGMGGI